VSQARKHHLGYILSQMRVSSQMSQSDEIHQAHMPLYKLLKARLVARFRIQSKQVDVSPVHFGYKEPAAWQ